MKIYKCPIECLYEHIDHEAILKFRDKKVIFEKITTTADEHSADIVIKEDSTDSILKKLTIKSEKRFLIAGTFPNTVFICLDQKEEKLSCYTHFVKTNKGLRQKCDFAFMHRHNNTIHIVISELKSSRKGLNDRCDGQFSRSKVFLKYLIELIHEVENINPNFDFCFYKAIFIPLQMCAIATPDPITPTKNKIYSKLIKNTYTIFELETDLDGAAEINIQSLVSAIPKTFISFPKKIALKKPPQSKSIFATNSHQKTKKHQQSSSPRWT